MTSSRNATNQKVTLDHPARQVDKHVSTAATERVSADAPGPGPGPAHSPAPSPSPSPRPTPPSGARNRQPQKEAPPRPSSPSLPDGKPGSRRRIVAADTDTDTEQDHPCWVLHWVVSSWSKRAKRGEDGALPPLLECECTEFQDAEELRCFVDGLVGTTGTSCGDNDCGGGGGGGSGSSSSSSSSRKPLIVLHGFPVAFLRVLFDSPLGIDWAFVDAHAAKRRYKPKPKLRTAAAGCAQWDYPELVMGFEHAIRSDRAHTLPVDRLGRVAVRPISDREDLAAAFCRASLWRAREVDVLFLDRQPWDEPGHRLLMRARKRTVTLSSISRGYSAAKAERRRDIGILTGTKIPGLVTSLQKKILSTPPEIGEDDLLDRLEETVYDQWLELFEGLTPRQQPVIYDGTSLEWQVLQFLEGNLDMTRDLLGRTRPTAPHQDWADLIHRLRLRIDLLPTVHPIPAIHTEPDISGAAPREKKETSKESAPFTEQQSPAHIPIPRRRHEQPSVSHVATPGAEPPSSADDNQRALDRVTYLGGILLPISIVTSVLSMNEDFEPGQPLFWVFWAAAVPLTALTMVVIYADKLRGAEVWVEVSNWGGSSDGEGEEEEEKEAKEEEHELKVEPQEEYGGREEENCRREGKKKGRKTKKKRAQAEIPENRKPSLPVEPTDRISVLPEAVTYSGEEVIIDMGGGAGAGAGAPPQAQTISIEQLETPPRVPSHGGRPQDPTDPDLVLAHPYSQSGPRPKVWRKKQLGWGGAAMCILKMQKPPHRVEDGVPVTRRRPGGQRTVV